MPRSRFALISCVYVPYARSILRLKCSLRLLMLSTSLSSWCARRRLYAARFDFLRARAPAVLRSGRLQSPMNYTN